MAIIDIYIYLRLVKIMMKNVASWNNLALELIFLGFRRQPNFGPPSKNAPILSVKHCAVLPVVWR